MGRVWTPTFLIDGLGKVTVQNPACVALRMPLSFFML